MREQVNVINMEDEAYQEKFMDQDVFIPAKGRILMGRREAVKFLGQHAGMNPKTGQPKVKNLVIEAINGKKVEVVPEFICNLCAMKFATQTELDEHSKVHKDQTFKDERLEKETQKTGAAPADAKTGPACPFCGLTVASPHGLKIHLASCKGAVKG